MAETANTIPAKGLGKLHFSDFWKSLFLAAIVNVLLTLYPVINSGHWPTHTDLSNMLTSTVAIIIGYLIKNLSTNNTGKILAKDEPVTTVPTEKLEDLKEKAAQADAIPTLPKIK